MGSCHLPREEHTLTQAALESQGEKVKEKQTLILFKGELSSNLCSPKMELADCRGRSILAELGGHLSGAGQWPSTQHLAP